MQNSITILVTVHPTSFAGCWQLSRMASSSDPGKKWGEGFPKRPENSSENLIPAMASSP